MLMFYADDCGTSFEVRDGVIKLYGLTRDVMAAAEDIRKHFHIVMKEVIYADRESILKDKVIYKYMYLCTV